MTSEVIETMTVKSLAYLPDQRTCPGRQLEETLHRTGDVAAFFRVHGEYFVSLRAIAPGVRRRAHVSPGHRASSHRSLSARLHGVHLDVPGHAFERQVAQIAATLPADHGYLRINRSTVVHRR